MAPVAPALATVKEHPAGGGVLERMPTAVVDGRSRPDVVAALRAADGAFVEPSGTAWAFALDGSGRDGTATLRLGRGDDLISDLVFRLGADRPFLEAMAQTERLALTVGVGGPDDERAPLVVVKADVVPLLAMLAVTRAKGGG